MWEHPQDHFVVIKDEKVCLFVKLEIILPLLCCLLHPLTNKHCRSWSSMIILWIDSRISQNYRILLSARHSSNNYLELFKKMVWRILCCRIDHTLLESSLWYGFAKYLNQFFRSSHHVLDIYVLNIEENHLFSQLS